MVYKAVCMSGRCFQAYTGMEDNIHFWTKETACGDEIGWDFVDSVVRTKTSFSAYVNLKSAHYISLHECSVPFMSRSTFVSWFFSWASSFNVDFRQSVDPWCGHSPRVLACDATHIGVSLKNLSLEPITKEDASIVVSNRHKRNNRVFLPYHGRSSEADIRKSREHLKLICEHVLSTNPAVVDLEEIRVNNSLLFSVCPLDTRCITLLESFCSRSFEVDVLQALARFILLLSRDAPVSAVLSPRFSHVIVKVIDEYAEGNYGSISSLRNVSPELSSLLLTACSSAEKDRLVLVRFVQYLLDFVQLTHSDDHPTPDPVAIPSSYNPESGVAYYFTPTGARLRALPH
jgi:hypothetical protein